MKIGIICGSQRANSNSLKVGRLIEARVAKNLPKVETLLIDLGGSESLPFWDGDALGIEKSDIALAWQGMSKELSSCHGFVFIVPEWGGMAPAVMKNFFLYCTKGQLRHKPGMIITVSNGIGGSYPIAELRMSSYKNTGLFYIPEQVILRFIDKFFADLDKMELDTTRNLSGRIDHGLAVLVAYAQAVTVVRENKALDFTKFPNGM